MKEIKRNSLKINDATGLSFSQEVIDAGYRVIDNGKVNRCVGLGWIEEHDATPEDYKTIPVVID